MSNPLADKGDSGRNLRPESPDPMTKRKPKQDPADRTQFSLNAEQWEQFQAALDAPVRDMPRLRALLEAPSCFDAEDLPVKKGLTIDDLIAAYGRSMTHPDKHPHDGSRPVPPSTLQRALDRRRDNLGDPNPWTTLGRAVRVTRDIPAHALATGNPARVRGWVCACGVKLGDDFVCSGCRKKYRKTTTGLEPA